MIRPHSENKSRSICRRTLPRLISFVSVLYEPSDHSVLKKRKEYADSHGRHPPKSRGVVGRALLAAQINKSGLSCGDADKVERGQIVAVKSRWPSRMRPSRRPRSERRKAFLVVPSSFDPAPGFPEAGMLRLREAALEAVSPARVVYLSTIGGELPVEPSDPAYNHQRGSGLLLMPDYFSAARMVHGELQLGRGSGARRE